jgi:ABC-type branched-subunit amino acid transport system substrate-binding protein
MIRVLTLVLASLLTVASPALAQKAPGVTDTEVVIGITMPLSGPAAAWGNTGVAMEAWTRHLNEQGGINGRKLRVVMKDDGYNPGRAVANNRQAVDRVRVRSQLEGRPVGGRVDQR